MLRVTWRPCCSWLTGFSPSPTSASSAGDRTTFRSTSRTCSADDPRSAWSRSSSSSRRLRRVGMARHSAAGPGGDRAAARPPLVHDRDAGGDTLRRRGRDGRAGSRPSRGRGLAVVRGRRRRRGQPREPREILRRHVGQRFPRPCIARPSHARATARLQPRGPRTRLRHLPGRLVLPLPRVAGTDR